MTYTINETPREAYDKIVAYFTRPGAVLAAFEVTHKGLLYPQCSYRIGQNPEGPACAVGCLIPNDQYDPAIDEGDEKGIRHLHERELLTVIDSDTLVFLDRAQQIDVEEAQKLEAAEYTAFLETANNEAGAA